MGQKKLVRKAEPPSKRGIAWPRWTGFRGMTLRSWLELLVVPLALVVISFLFTVQQDQRQQRTENQRAEAERELAEQSAQDEALQVYLDQMSQLMLERKLLEAEPGDLVHTLAQARTSTVILRLDAEHNESVIRFLINSGLAVKRDASPRLLSEIALSHATLSHAYLHNAYLRNALLEGADLSGADISFAYVSEANLHDADLRHVDLRWAYLRHANLNHADLNHADLPQANLREANLSGANLSTTDLRDANLSGANLRDAYNVTNKQIEQQAGYLAGATMPNGDTVPTGKKYEDWDKDFCRRYQC